jgi:hypothetical protein
MEVEERAKRKRKKEKSGRRNDGQDACLLDIWLGWRISLCVCVCVCKCKESD